MESGFARQLMHCLQLGNRRVAKQSFGLGKLSPPMCAPPVCRGKRFISDKDLRRVVPANRPPGGLQMGPPNVAGICVVSTLRCSRLSPLNANRIDRNRLQGNKRGRTAAPPSSCSFGTAGRTTQPADRKKAFMERGEIFFFYRPKVGREEAHGADDVQRLYVVMRPESGDRNTETKQASDSGKEGSKRQGSKGGSTSEGGHGQEEVNIQQQPLLRFMVIGKKRLPDPSQKRHGPTWGFVELVTTKIEDIKEALRGEEYDTATRGHRIKPAARALGEGVYRILKHVSGRQRHTYLIYKLEFPTPDKENEPQESLNIEREASFIIQIKNPGQYSPPNVGIQSKRKAGFPAHLQAHLGSRRFCPADPPDFLNYEGCEFLLISASDDNEGELGLEIKGKDQSGQAYLDLTNMFGDTASIKPLIEGTWA